MKIIGMIHLETLPGSKGHKNMKHVTKKALQDAEALIKGGVDSILIENTEDHPHTEKLKEEAILAFISIAKEIVQRVTVSVGICALWNDYKAGLRIAKASGASFIRVPVFVDKFKTEAGIITGTPEDVISFRKQINAEKIKIMADIHVKHSVRLTKRTIEESAKDALAKGADELIVTGKVTGDAPVIDDLRRVRNACPNAKILVGSGTTPQNLKDFAKYADAAIVGTYIKINDKVSPDKVKEIVNQGKRLIR
ncbi:MAG TPA: BtpA/SgcQ family protein [Candidatus Nanoarchaeia archaeon]|nr:BtpA/SgcQ family protein [Candidatus Nanoarchaeia archaeon]